METTMTATRIDRGSTETTTIYSEGGDLVFERTFDAPREQVWKAFTDPELVPRWWGPHGTTTTVVEMDVRPGGKWRYVSSAAGPRGRGVLRRVPGGRPARGLQVDLHVRRRGRRPAGRPRDLHPRGPRRQDQGHLHRAHGLARGRSRAPWRPAWSAARSRPGTASRPCSPKARPLRRRHAREGAVGASERNPGGPGVPSLVGRPALPRPGPQEDRPIAKVQPDRAAWPSYATVAAAAYVIYGIGAIAPYLRNDLGLSEAQVGLHSTMLAIGLIAAGLIAAELDRRLGEVAIRRLAIGAIAVAVVALGTAAALGVTLLGGDAGGVRHGHGARLRQRRARSTPGDGWPGSGLPARMSGRWSRPLSARSPWRRPPRSTHRGGSGSLRP